MLAFEKRSLSFRRSVSTHSQQAHVSMGYLGADSCCATYSEQGGIFRSRCHCRCYWLEVALSHKSEGVLRQGFGLGCESILPASPIASMNAPKMFVDVTNSVLW